MQTVYHKNTGEAFVRDPVDCQEMLASGMYVIDKPADEDEQQKKEAAKSKAEQKRTAAK